MSHRWAIEGVSCSGPLGSGFEVEGLGTFYHGGCFPSGAPVRNGEAAAFRVRSIDLDLRPQQDMPASVLYPAILRRVYWGKLQCRYMWVAGVEWITFKGDLEVQLRPAAMRADAAAILQQYSDIPLACVEGGFLKLVSCPREFEDCTRDKYCSRCHVIRGTCHAIHSIHLRCNGASAVPDFFDGVQR